MRPTIGFLCSRVRVEERLLLEELARRDVEVVRIDPGQLITPLDDGPPRVDAVFDRCLSFGQSSHLMHAYAAFGVPCVNRPEVIDVCGDKVRTHLALTIAHVPTPRTMLAFSPESALEAIESLGYPVVIKPVVGSWGRLVARLNDRDAAEAVLEDRSTLGGWQHQVFYVQQLVKKPGRDIRSFAVDGEVIAAIYRHSEHWITNTARGATTSNCPITDDVRHATLSAANAVGGGVVAVDLVEDQDGKILVLEVNHTMEFRNSIAPTGVDIPARIVDYVLSRARNGSS